jgi:hypothetical protein
MRTISDEAKLFARMAIFGLVVGGAYWLLTGERAGTVLLVAFGLAAAVAALALLVGSRRGRGTPVRPNGVAGDALERGQGLPALVGEPVPEPGWAPIGVGIGIGGLALGAIYGPWLAVAGLLLAISAGWSWLSAAMREADSVAGGEARRRG